MDYVEVRSSRGELVGVRLLVKAIIAKRPHLTRFQLSLE